MLFIDTTAWEVIQICMTSLVGIFAVSASLEGYLLQPMVWYHRVIALVGGLLLIYPGFVTDVIGIGFVAVIIFLQVLAKKKNTLQMS